MYDLPPPPDVERWPFGLIIRAAMYLGCGRRTVESWTLESLSRAIQARAENPEYWPENTIRNWIYGDTGIAPGGQSTSWVKKVLFEHGEIGAKPEAFAPEWLRILDAAIRYDRALGSNDTERRAARKAKFAELVPGGGQQGFSLWEANLHDSSLLWQETFFPSDTPRRLTGPTPEEILGLNNEDVDEQQDISLSNMSAEAGALLAHTKEFLSENNFGAAQGKLDQALNVLGDQSDRESMIRDARARIYLEKSWVDIKHVREITKQSWAAHSEQKESITAICESSLLSCDRAAQNISVSELDLVARLEESRRRSLRFLILASLSLEGAREVVARFGRVGLSLDPMSLAAFFYMHRDKDEIINLIEAQPGAESFNHHCVATAISKAWNFRAGYEILNAFLKTGVEVSKASWGRVASMMTTRHHPSMLIRLYQEYGVAPSSSFFHTMVEHTPSYRGVRRIRIQARRSGVRFSLAGFTMMARSTRNVGEVRHLYRTAKALNLSMDAFFFNALISGVRNQKEGRCITAVMRRHGIKRDMVTYGTLLSKASNADEVDKALTLVKAGKEKPNRIFFNILISKLTGLREARQTHICMRREHNVTANHGTFVSMLRVCVNPREAKFVQILSRHAGCEIELKDGIFFERAAEECTDLKECYRLIKLMEDQKPYVAPNSFIASALLRNCVDEVQARDMYRRLDALNAVFDEYSFSKMIDLSSTYPSARSWYHEMKRRGIKVNRVVMTTLVKRAGPGEAKALLKRFIAENEELDAQLFTTIMLLSKRTEKYAFARAESILRAQLRLGVRPNKYSYQTVISYAKDKGEALPVLREMMDDGFTPNRTGWAILNALGIYQADVLPKH